MRDSEETPDDGIDEDEDEEGFATQEITAIEIKHKEPQRLKCKQKVSTSDDLLIGHIDGDRPLLDCNEEEEDDNNERDKCSPHSSQVTAIVQSVPSIASDVFASAPFRKPIRSKKKVEKSDMESEGVKLMDTTTSGDEVDEEVARNLRAQVAKDTMSGGVKDSFGLKPFTEQHLVCVLFAIFIILNYFPLFSPSIITLNNRPKRCKSNTFKSSKYHNRLQL